jgi:transcriptional regulator with XRE-family HTH domain
MEFADEKTSGSLLRQQRVLRGWSQKELARRLNAMVDQEEEITDDCGTRLGGVTGDMVRKWERGFHLPSPFYRHRFCQLFHLSATELGFIKSDEDEPDCDEKNPIPFQLIPQMEAEEHNNVSVETPYPEPHTSAKTQSLLLLLSHTMQKSIEEAILFFLIQKEPFVWLSSKKMKQDNVILLCLIKSIAFYS